MLVEITVHSTVLKKLTVADLFKKVTFFSTASIFIAAFTISCHWIRKYYTLLHTHFNIILPITPSTTDFDVITSVGSGDIQEQS